MPKLATLLLLFGLTAAAPALGQTPDIPEAPRPAPTKEKATPPPTVDPAPVETAAPAVTSASPEVTNTAAPTAAPPKTEGVAKAARAGGRLAVNPEGNTGILRVAAAESVAPKLIRLSFALQWFTAGSVFGTDDGATRVGAILGISGSPMDYLELWLNVRANSTANDLTTPTLLQSQGDLSIGVKGFYPVAKIASVGVDAQATLLSGIGGTSFDLSSTELRLRALLTSDLMRATEKIPIRAHLNAGITFDNSNQLLGEGQRLTNAERFALGIGDFHRFGLWLGVEVPLAYVTPYIEYVAEVPLGYRATPGVVISGQPLRPAQTMPTVTDALALPAITRVMPQRLTPGIRVTAIPKLTLDLAVEVGLTPDIATGVVAVPPYNVWLFASYPLDPFNEVEAKGPVGPPIAVPVIIPEAVAPAPTTGKLTGLVKDQSTNKVVEGAVIAFDRSPPVATAASGRFESLPIEPGPLSITVKKDGYEPGSTKLDLAAGDAPEIEVALVPSIKEGVIKGRVVDDKDKPVPNAPVELSGAATKATTTNESGAFELKVPAGKYTVAVEDPQYLKKSKDVDLAGGATYSVELMVRKRPKESVVEVKGDRILVKKAVHFVTGEARLAPDAAALLDAVVDVMVANKTIKVRIEGHTDNVGAEEANLSLSKARAEAVATYLAEQGIDRGRLSSEGYGPNRPIAPNLTRVGREQNRRVEFIIVEQ